MKIDYIIKKSKAVLIIVLLLVAVFSITACQNQAADADPVPRKRSFLGYAAEVLHADVPARMQTGSTVMVPVTLLNSGKEPWFSNEDSTFQLSYHWRHESGRTEIYWGKKTPLPSFVGPGEVIQTTLLVEAPGQAKYYYLVIDVMKENAGEAAVLWFEEKTDSAFKARVDIVN